MNAGCERCLAENFVFEAELQIPILDRGHITVLIIGVFWDVLTY
jgi:hypothetical protein